MAVMRAAISLILISFLACSLWAADDGEIRKLEEAKRIFDLRRVLEQTSDDLGDMRYYRALTLSAHQPGASMLKILPNSVQKLKIALQQGRTKGDRTPPLNPKIFFEIFH